VANNLVKEITTRDVRELIGQPALTNNYLVTIPVLSSEVGNNQNLGKHIENYGRLTDGDFLKRKLGLLCSDASLPTSSYATAEVKDNFVGVTQEFAHTRLYADTDFTFYVDKNYDSLKFFEAWMDYISGAGEVSQVNKPGYFRRMAYPEYYKVSEMSITKFERNISGEHLKYTFINAFPKSMTAIPVAYGAADLLKVTVSFNYDRYIIEREEKGLIDNPGLLVSVADLPEGAQLVGSKDISDSQQQNDYFVPSTGKLYTVIETRAGSKPNVVF
jgi:hypothetical protein